MDRKCTALVGDALRLIAALSRSKDGTEIRAAENRDSPWNWRMMRKRGAVRWQCRQSARPCEVPGLGSIRSLGGRRAIDTEVRRSEAEPNR